MKALGKARMVKAALRCRRRRVDLSRAGTCLCGAAVRSHFDTLNRFRGCAWARRSA